MKYTLTMLMCALLFYCSDAFSQNEVLLSGNNSSSAMVCSSGKIMTWGSNRVTVGSTTYYGLLAIGNTSSNFISTPTQVIGSSTFNNLTFTQVSAGSGNHFVALACDSTVWAWGFNGKGQVGNGTSGTVVEVPTQVKAGVLTGTSYDDGSGFLKGVKVVHAASSNTFAILRDGRLVSWGANNDEANGLLGDDSQEDKLTPVFVINGATDSPLTNVKSVSVGDNVAYALIDEDKDGKGTVYSWGNGINGTLGRYADGTSGNPLGTISTTGVNTISTTAFPVQFADSKPLDNIVSISAGDVFSLALDVKGNVWAWGLNAWGGVTGQSLQASHSDPRKVQKGTVKTQGADPGNTYLRAKSIAGGQGFAMAVTVEGKPVSWGNNSGCIGGVLGNGQPTSPTSSFNPGPSYIINNTNTIDSNVVAIYRGDTWGFYVTKENKVMTWGCNENGQLGIGNNTLQLKATSLANIPNCGFNDLRPFLGLDKKDTSVCTSKLVNTPFVIQSGFEVAPSLSNKYQISWYKNGSLIKGPLLASGANLSFTVSTPGTYKAVIHYTGTLSTCFAYEDASQQFVVTGFAPSYSLPNDLVYDNDTLKPYVLPSQPSLNPTFVWYASVSSTTPLDTTTGAQKGAILKTAPGIVKGAGDAITLYAEEKAYSSGSVFRKEQSCNPLFSQLDILNNNGNTVLFQTQLTAFESLTLTEFKLMLKTTIFQSGTTLAGNLNFAVYGAKKDINGRWVPDETKVYGSFNKTFSITRNAADPMDVTTPITIVCNVKVPSNSSETVFYISAQRVALSNLTGNGLVQVGRAGCVQTGIPLLDNISGKTIAFTGTCQGFLNPELYPTGGSFFDIKFETSQQFCDRLPVTLRPKLTTQLTERPDENSASTQLKLFPNPSKGNFSMQVEREGLIRVLNLQGMEVYRSSATKGVNTISLENMPKSTYIVELIGLNTIQRSKLMIE